MPIHLVPQFSRTLKRNNLPCLEHHILISLWISTPTPSLLTYLILSESRHKDVLTGSKGTIDNLKEDLNCLYGLCLGTPIGLGKLFQKYEVHSEVNPLSRDELSKLLKTVHDKFTDNYPLFLLLARTGVRIGETLALKWTDIDFDQRLITVHRSINKFGKPDTPKSAKARRVDISEQLMVVLQDLQRFRKVQKLKYGWGKISEWVFSNKRGNHLDENNWRNRVFNVALTNAKIRKVRIHDLRHTHASLLIQAGESLAHIRDQMGHHSIQVTVDIYGHLVPGGNKDAVDRLDDVDFDATIRNLSATK